jgi:cytochrome c553
MAKVVVPKMTEVFQAFDPKHYEKVTCATCHGKNAKEVGFKMPSPELPALPASETVFMNTVMKEKPQMVQFMGGKVTPEMAKLLGRKPFDHQKPDPNAFSCNACHTLKGAPDEKAHAG